MRFAAYASTSMVLATSVIIRALHQRTNFYSASVYLAQSNACLMILTNLVLLGLCTLLLVLQRLFYGPLRPIEVEQLYEKAWFAITETCLAMTIFRDEVGAWFLVMFVCLLVGKVWGWIGEGRVEVLEQQPPADPWGFHVRISVSLVMSSLFNVFLLRYSIQTVLLQARPNMMVMFAFEFAVLTVTSLSTVIRYLLTLYELSIINSQINSRRAQLRQERQHRENDTLNSVNSGSQELTGRDETAEDSVDTLDIDVSGWEEKGRWVFYLDLATDFFKLALYLTFFCVLCMFYGMPIHIIRDVALTIRSFYKRINDFVRYRQATKDMNARYPDATPEEISGEDVCIICREEMQAWVSSSNEQLNPDSSSNNNHATSHINERLRPKKLPCGHVLHFACLRSWLERQQNCPTCRAPVLVHNRHPVSSVVGGNPPNLPEVGPRDQTQEPQGQNGMRNEIRQPVVAPNVLNFGPFRLTFGVRQRQAQEAHVVNQPGQQAPVPVAPELRRLENTFGLIGRTPNAQLSANASSAQSNTQTQLLQIEQQLIRDISVIRAHADQLFLVRIIQSELARLRAVRETIEAPPNPIQVSSNEPDSPYQGPLAQPISIMQTFSPHHQHERPNSGHPDLPTGLTLPDGWNILPLQRLPDRITTDHNIWFPFQAFRGNTTTSMNGLVREPISQSVIDSSSSQESNDLLEGIASESGRISNSPDMAGQQTTSTHSETRSFDHATTSGFSDHQIREQPLVHNDISQPHSTNISSESNATIENKSQTSSTMSMTSDPGSSSTDHDIRWNRKIHSGAHRDSSENILHTDQGSASLTKSNEAKGKGKAATVEDFVEDTD